MTRAPDWTSGEFEAILEGRTAGYETIERRSQDAVEIIRDKALHRRRTYGTVLHSERSNPPLWFAVSGLYASYLPTDSEEGMDRVATVYIYRARRASARSVPRSSRTITGP